MIYNLGFIEKSMELNFYFDLHTKVKMRAKHFISLTCTFQKIKIRKSTSNNFTVWKSLKSKLSHFYWQKIREITVFPKDVTKELISRIFLVRVNFSVFLTFINLPSLVGKVSLF